MMLCTMNEALAKDETAATECQRMFPVPERDLIDSQYHERAPARSALANVCMWIHSPVDCWVQARLHGCTVDRRQSYGPCGAAETCTTTPSYLWRFLLYVNSRLTISLPFPSSRFTFFNLTPSSPFEPCSSIPSSLQTITFILSQSPWLAVSTAL